MAAGAAAAAAFFFGDESIDVAEMRGTCLREASGLTGVAAGALPGASVAGVRSYWKSYEYVVVVLGAFEAQHR